MLAMGRYALLLRPEMNRHLDREHIIRAVRHLDEAMALVPAGRVLLGPLAEQATSSSGAFDANPKMLERFMHRVEALYLDRYAVTNLEFQQFVDAGGYEKLEYWDEEALPALLDFVDETGQPGPRYWIEGQYQAGEERQARGRCELVRSFGLRPLGRQAPADRCRMDQGRRLAGRIGAGPHRPAALSVGRVVRHSPGEPVGLPPQRAGRRRRVRRRRKRRRRASARRQRVGMDAARRSSDSAEPSLHVPETFKSVRGGAFDTYFENHATCHYQSGEHPLARRHNIGFRLALPMSTLEVAEDDDAHGDGAEQPAHRSRRSRKHALATVVNVSLRFAAV